MSVELDIQVAEKVMGYVSLPEWKAWRTPNVPIVYSVPPYSTDIAAAMSVVEKMQEAGNDAEMLSHDGWWWVVFKKSHAPTERQTSQSLPEAICKAALTTIGNE